MTQQGVRQTEDLRALRVRWNMSIKLERGEAED